MKKSRKAAIAAAAFYAALNFNGCVYGPPADELDDAELVMDKSLSDELIEAKDEIQEDFDVR